MDEKEWLACDDVLRLLDRLGRMREKNGPGERKIRLFAVACCRGVWPRLKDRRSREAVETAERYADGLATSGELNSSWTTARKLADALKEETDSPAVRSYSVENAAAWAASRDVVRAAQLAAVWAGLAEWDWTTQPDLLRCISGNPFKAICIAPAVLASQGGVVVRMATAIYEERKWEDLPLLGDALEEAGVTDQAVLDHCRVSGPHARGCFVVDAILEQS
jgi:hypothetical protein